MFFKRLSRSSRSNSYVDDGYDSSPHSPSAANAKFDRYDAGARPDNRRQSQSQHNVPSEQTLSKDFHQISPPGSSDNEMYRAQHPDMYAPHGSLPSSRAVSGAQMNGMSHNAMPMDMPALAPTGSSKFEPAPDMLTRAFNDSIRPYTEKINELEAEIQDLRSWIETLEGERKDVHAWIDKRGLRPDVPPSIAKAMDSDPANTAAASTLSAQLDRKITIVNFDLHRLQDDLNDSISTGHFAASMLKFLPEISRLTGLPTGPKYAFDLVLKLGGNLNSHGGLDSANEEDAVARKDFFARLDEAMVNIVSRRFEEGEDWPVQREIRRLEKTAAYLRNYGVEPYFPRSLDLMKSEGGAGYGSDGQHSSSAGQHVNGSGGVNGVNGTYGQGGVPGDKPPNY